MGTAPDSIAVPSSAAELAEHLGVLAVNGAIKGKRATEAKDALPEGFEGEVSVVAHIRSKISKGVTLIGDPTTRPASVNLFTPANVAALLHKFGVTPTKLRTALRKLAVANADLTQANPELQNVFKEVSDEVVATLPRVHVPGTMRSPSVYSTPLDVDIRGA